MASLVVVGTGIKTLSHLTEETKVLIRHVEKVLYLVNEPLLKTWIIDNAKQSASLEPYYHATPKRVDAYETMTQKIIETYYNVESLCVAFYGHPILFTTSALTAVKRIREQGGHALVLPAVSAIDCLFSDLAINPGDKGYYSVDATDLLIYDKQIDPHSHLVIWQVNSLGAFNLKSTTKLPILMQYLKNFYPECHELILYEAPQYPRQKPKVKKAKLHTLVTQTVTPKTTLYVPPLPGRQLSQQYVDLLEMEMSQFLVSSDLDTTSK